MAGSSIVKNKEYDSVRLTISATNSGATTRYYSEAAGYRYFYNTISSTASASMEAVTFNAYLSFTSSNANTWNFTLIPMDYGHTVMLETKVLGMRSDGSKGFMMNSFGGYRHAGSSLSKIGNIQYTYCSDFTGGATAYFTASGTSSVNLVIGGESSTIIDWDVHIKYTKGYHTLVSGGGGGGGTPIPPWFPAPDER